MKGRRSNKSYNTRFSCRIDRLLPFGLHNNHIPGDKLEIADYNSRQKAAVTNKTVVATIHCFCDVFSSLYKNATIISVFNSKN